MRCRHWPGQTRCEVCELDIEGSDRDPTTKARQMAGMTLEQAWAEARRLKSEGLEDDIFRCGVCGYYECKGALVVYPHLTWPETIGECMYHRDCIPQQDQMVFALRDQIKSLGAEPCA